MQYRREIDGLRALAVVPVILFHAGFQLFQGGHVGVDVFFVISGYLITSIIVTEKMEQTFSLKSFYLRRAKRILPALFFMMLCCIPLSWKWMSPSDLKDATQSASQASIFISNLYFYNSSDRYFDVESSYKPLLHTWSLAVEEQFYLFFPLLFSLLWPLGRRLLLLIMGLCCALSLAICQWKAFNLPTEAFFFLTSRFWELLVGAIAAVVMIGGRLSFGTYSKQALSLIGVVCILLPVFSFHKHLPLPSIYTLAPVLGTAFVLVFADQQTWVGKLLGIPLLVQIGLLSYSAYLWHQPIFVFTRLRLIDEPGVLLMLSATILTFVFAYGSWRFVEKPFRYSKRLNIKYFLIGLGLCILVFQSVGTIVQLTDGAGGRLAVTGKSYREIEDASKPTPGLKDECENGFKPDVCANAPDPEILIWGDSFARPVVPALLASNAHAKVIQFTRGACAPILGEAAMLEGRNIWLATKCQSYNQQVKDWIKNQKSLKYAVLASPFFVNLNEHNTLLLDNGEVVASETPVVLKHLLETLDFLKTLGITPVVIAPPPASGKNIGRCLFKAAIFEHAVDVCDISQSNLMAAQLPVYALLKEVEKHYKVIWLDGELCKNGRCRATQGDKSLYYDNIHVSKQGAEYLGKKLDLYNLVTSHVLSEVTGTPNIKNSK